MRKGLAVFTLSAILLMIMSTTLLLAGSSKIANQPTQEEPPQISANTEMGMLDLSGAPPLNRITGISQAHAGLPLEAIPHPLREEGIPRIYEAASPGAEIELAIEIPKELRVEKVFEKPIEVMAKGPSVTLRAEGDATADIVASMTPGQKMTATRQIAGWYEVTLADGKSGYVLSSHTAAYDPVESALLSGMGSGTLTSKVTRPKVTGGSDSAPAIASADTPEGNGQAPAEAPAEAPVEAPAEEAAEASGGSYMTFTATAYCACVRCCGKSDGITASGVKAVQGVTIAADRRVLKMGTRVYIKGIGERVVQDTGVRGKKIDIFFNSHQEALNFGRRKVQLQIL